MMTVLNRKVGLYIANIIALLALGVAAGGVAAEFGRNMLHLSTQTSQAILTVCVPLFMSFLELWGMKHLLGRDKVE